MTDSSDFYTLKGYQQNTANQLTLALEDYLEMIYRLLLRSPVVRIGDLSKNLNVKPSSSTKMLQLLKDKGVELVEHFIEKTTLKLLMFRSFYILFKIILEHI